MQEVFVSLEAQVKTKQVRGRLLLDIHLDHEPKVSHILSYTQLIVLASVTQKS